MNRTTSVEIKAPTPTLPLRGREQKVPLWGI